MEVAIKIRDRGYGLSMRTSVTTPSPPRTRTAANSPPPISCRHSC